MAALLTPRQGEGTAGRRNKSREPGGIFNPTPRPVRSAYRRESAVERMGQSLSINSFIAWVLAKPRGFEQVNEFFAQENQTGWYGEHSLHGMRGISRSKWISCLAVIGFRDPAMAGDVFDHIVLESGSGESAVKQNASVLDTKGQDEDFVYQQQLKRFELRVMAVNSTLLATMDNSPAKRFIESVRLKHGSSTVRAWACDIDVRKAGRVARNDFFHVCRTMGFSAQARLIWDNFRPDKQAPLEVHDLDPKEADNMEDFCDALWNSVGFDLDKAWSFMDPNNQMYVPKENFMESSIYLGFEGDADLIYRGLNTSGLKRGITKGEFLYLRKISRLAQRRLGGLQQGHGSVSDLIAWVQRELGGVHELLAKLRIGSIGNATVILVSDLAARLTALGFEGDALGAASRAARLEGGCTISADALYTLLSGSRSLHSEAGRSATPSARSKTPPRARTPQASLQPLENRADWCNSVDDIGAANTQKSHGTKSSFDRSTTPEFRSQRNSLTPRRKRGESMFLDHTIQREATPLGKATNVNTTTRRVPSSRRNASPRRPASPRPEWNNSFDLQQSSNLNMGAHTRKYFSDPFEKPIRTEMRHKLQARAARREQDPRGGVLAQWEQQTLRPEDIRCY